MDGVFFYIDFVALALVLAGAVLLHFGRRWRNQFEEPYLSYSHLKNLPSGLGRAGRKDWPSIVLWIAFISFALAFIDPHLLIERTAEPGSLPGIEEPNKSIPNPTEGIAIYILLDQSGSMKEEVSVGEKSGNRRNLTKIELLKQVTRQFIKGDPGGRFKGRPDDLIGLVFFARAARVMSPLTLDHAHVLEQLAQFNVVADRDEDGTSIGYAIFKTANLIAATRHYSQELVVKGTPAYIIKSYVMILVTDGLQDSNPLDKGKRLRNIDVPEAAAYAKEQNIRLYIVNVEPKLGTEEFAPYRHIMQRAAELTGGKFYMVDGTDGLDKIYRDIDLLEKSALPEPFLAAVQKKERPDLYRRFSFAPFLIALALGCLLVYVGMETMIFRRVP